MNRQQGHILQPVAPALRKLMALDRLDDVVGMARESASGTGALLRLLALLKISWEFNAGGLKSIPASGPVVLVANHPFGLLEGAILAAVLPQVRPDVRILANSVLSSIPELRERCIFVDPFGRRESHASNALALRRCIAWLESGGLLAGFPAGEVAHFDWREGNICDPVWNPTLGRIAQHTGSAAVPVFFHGANSMAFQLAGVVHPSLRTVSLPRELLNKRGRHIRIEVGKAVLSERLQRFAGGAAATEYLRYRTYSLATPQKIANPFERMAAALRVPPAERSAIASPGAPQRVRAELSKLPALSEGHGFAVVLARAEEIPATLQEIGRLREITFRRAGEGAGRATDLDRFDSHYQHLVLCRREQGEVAGAYRLGPTSEILPRLGVSGLYTGTLFRYRPELFHELGPALELGRSFIRQEHQRQFAPLMLLWRGIVRCAIQSGCGVLFGAVSISNDYAPLSRYLMERFLHTRRIDRLAALVSARCPYRHETAMPRRAAGLTYEAADIEDLSSLVAEIEKDGKGVPVLVRQYLKAGGRVLGTNVDRRFSNTLDALIMVDLESLPPAMIARYAGRGEAKAPCAG